ncbi:MAG: tRNA (N(6)-L-threonylcarbamoyladenosine(37)-C(2))-methylthiotransferase [Euryarchaeota archaeon]|nr:tRNA (N(6)-L-threonylcarbamoyladenosine(37)-C(2))-methylthiotransferase [Euryarchaeota archaeon]
MQVYLETHGCAVTQGESRVIESVLVRDGHALSPTLADADTAIIVTCAVVERTERDMARRIAALKESGKDVIVTGCLATSRADLIRDIAPQAIILPPQGVAHASTVIETGVVPPKKDPRVRVRRQDSAPVETIVINDGCTGNCSFCITKLARPGLETFSIDDITADVRDAVDAGAVEIRLTSMDTAAYGAGTGPRLPALLQRVSRVDGDFRVRVGMMNPFALEPILDDLIEAFREPKLFKFLHLPVQSGSDPILTAMGRHHTAADFKDIVARFRAEFPDITIATDVITGFPEEDETAFEATVRLLDDVSPDIINITRFSRRPGTRADAFGGQVPSRVATDRSRILTKHRLRTSRERLRRHVGRRVRVLATERLRQGSVVGRTQEYRQVVLPDVPLARWYDVEVTGSTDHWLVGEIVSGGVAPTETSHQAE